MSTGLAAALALLTGFAVMSLELTAVRLLAPHFGDSAYVWTNVIGVMLVALAAGAWIGGRLARPADIERRLLRIFVVAGVLVAVVPWLARPFGDWLLPGELLLDDATPALVRGSLAATALMFAPPVTLIGCLTPMLVAALAHAKVPVGRASGLIAAQSTLGSLLGTFLTTHLLIPEIGSRATVWLCAGFLLACGGLLSTRRWTTAAGALPLTFLFVASGPARAPAVGHELLAEVESRYQYLQVVRSGDAGERVTRLQINEGLDSFHSISREDSPYTGAYYDFHATVPFLIGDGAAPAPLRVLSLGAAAGTFGRVFAAAHPDCRVDGVEIDAAVVELGEEYFGGRGAAGRVCAGLDARVFVERAVAVYDLILVDAYERQVYIPAHVASRQFFTAVQRRLAPGGAVSINVGGVVFDDPVVQVVGRTMAAVFGEAWAFRVPRSRNFMLVARQGSSIDLDVLQRVSVGDERLRQIVAQAARRSAWRRIAPGEPVLDDDQPCLDRLQDAALSERGAGVGAGLTEFTGTEPAADVGDRVRGDLLDDPEGALVRLRTAAAASAELRLFAGHARWLLRDLAGACAEYEAGLRLAPADGISTQLRSSLQTCREDQQPGLLAASVATRNGWLALAAAATFLVCFVTVDRGLARR